MKILLYTEGEKLLHNSGLGKAIEHQKKALKENGIPYTTDKNDDFDIVHINFYGPKSYFFAKKAHKMGKKVVYHAHSTEEDFRDGFFFSKATSKLFKKWIIKCYNLGDVIITPTPYSKRLLEGYGIKKPIYALSNGIELDLFKKDKKARSKFLKKYNFSKEDKIVIAIGLYIERKGIIDFVELAKRLPEYKFVWFGSSPLYLTTSKVRKAVNTKLPNLTFTGYVPQKEIKEALNSCDLYVFPTYEETEGIPIIEACACETKALIRDIPVFDDWLIDGKNVYKAKDINEFEKKIKRILNNELPDLTKESYKVASERDIKKVGKKLVEIYKKVLKS
ncbi:MAG: glycosyltransferase [Bacilli bacterium]|nr:glycosyltransferase [Bacilli bacterium]